MNRETVINAANAFAKKYSNYELGDHTGRFTVEDLIDGLSFIVRETHKGIASYEEDGDAWSILEVTDNAGQITYWKVPGSWNSYEGVSYDIDQISQVAPKEKVIIVWE
jgi:hypothetical protein